MVGNSVRRKRMTHAQRLVALACCFTVVVSTDCADSGTAFCASGAPRWCFKADRGFARSWGRVGKSSCFRMQMHVGPQDLSIVPILPPTKVFLHDITASRTTKKAKMQLFEDLERRHECSKTMHRDYLDMVIAEANTVRNIRWAMIRWPLALPSYRANLGCFNR